MQITNELVEKKYSEGLDTILDLFTQVSTKIKSLEEDNRKLKKSFIELKPNRSCPECIVKQFDIDKLEEENKSLKQKLKYRQGQDYFGSSTPSAKKKFKEKSKEEKTLFLSGKGKSSLKQILLTEEKPIFKQGR